MSKPKNFDFSKIRQINAPYLVNKPASYKNGDGVAAYVVENKARY
jgi:hypothetical protein